MTIPKALFEDVMGFKTDEYHNLSYLCNNTMRCSQKIHDTSFFFNCMDYITDNKYELNYHTYKTASKTNVNYIRLFKSGDLVFESHHLENADRFTKFDHMYHTAMFVFTEKFTVKKEDNNLIVSKLGFESVDYEDKSIVYSVSSGDDEEAYEYMNSLSKEKLIIKIASFINLLETK